MKSKGYWNRRANLRFGLEVVFLLPVVILFLGMDEIEGRKICEKEPTTTRHVIYGAGSCLPWTPPDDQYTCCFFCNILDYSIAAQFILPGGYDPFNGNRYNEGACCCYTSGRIIDGGDGRVLFE